MGLSKDPEASLGSVGSLSHGCFDLDGDRSRESITPTPIFVGGCEPAFLDHLLLDSSTESGGSSRAHSIEPPPLEIGLGPDASESRSL